LKKKRTLGKSADSKRSKSERKGAARRGKASAPISKKLEEKKNKIRTGIKGAWWKMVGEGHGRTRDCLQAKRVRDWVYGGIKLIRNDNCRR